ncbi:MAG: alpha amylase catalytic [Bacteroidetes bacterium]|nr:MAG: alpha amylase catalytic [Bacteroidota bacterium]
MIRTFLRIFIAFLLLFSISCNKEKENPNPPDPPVEDSIYQQYGTPFTGIPETEDIVMYEVNLRAFSSSGDLQGVTDRLDELADLKVNVIWLMPIHPVGQVNSVNSPYSVKDYKAVGPEYGTLNDLRELTDEAHSRGMAVIMDWVANHTAWDNAWISNKSWYTQDGNGNIIHPAGTNWLDVADLNFSNQKMRDAMIDAMKFWAYEANIDGFRCDYADGVPFDFWKQAIDSIRSIDGRDFIWFAEGARNDHFAAGFDLSFGWQFYGAIKEVFNGQPVSRIFTAHTNEYASAPAGKHWVRFTTNHDESAWDATPISLFNGIDGALAASVVGIFTGGVPLIYGSQEVGTLANIPFFSNSTINWGSNPEMLLTYEKMLQFYASSATARKGVNKIYQHSDVACFKKELNGDEVVIMVNLRNVPVGYTIPAELRNTQWLEVINESNITLGTQMTLEPYQFLLMRKQS